MFRQQTKLRARAGGTLAWSIKSHFVQYYYVLIVLGLCQFAHLEIIMTTAMRAPLPSPRRKITRQFLVYLAGPITGLSWEESTAWYAEVDKLLPEHIVPVFPLRGKMWLEDEISIKDNYDDKHPLSTQAGIMTRDKLDVMRADALLVNLLGAKSVSVGTVIEIAWAYMLQKPVIVIMEKDNIHQHSMVRGCASMVVETLPLGIDTVIRIVSPTFPASD